MNWRGWSGRHRGVEREDHETAKEFRQDKDILLKWLLATMSATGLGFLWYINGRQQDSAKAQAQMQADIQVLLERTTNLRSDQENTRINEAHLQAEIDDLRGRR